MAGRAHGPLPSPCTWQHARHSPWMVDLETKAIRAEVTLRAALQLRAGGLVPDVIVAAPGLGRALKDVR